MEAIRKIVRDGEDVVRRLVDSPDTGDWGDGAAAEMGLAAEFRCEYCDKDLLESVDAYKDWQIDHIDPRSKGGPTTRENSALSCRQCNVSFKRSTSISQMEDYVNGWKVRTGPC